MIDYAQVPQSQHAIINEPKKRPTSQDTGYPWSSYEGFNLILLEQCKFLVNDLGLSSDIYKVVLALWVSYLKKTEVAFISSDVKLSLGATHRDIVKFVENAPQVNYTQSPGMRVSKFRSSDMISKRVCSMDVEIVDQVHPSKIYSQPSSKKPRFARMVNSLLNEEPIDDSATEESSDYQTPGTDDSIPWPEPEVILTTQEQSTKVPEEKMNKFSRGLHRMVTSGKIETARHVESLMGLDRMSMTTTLAFLLITFRLLQLDIVTSDVLNWVDCGHLPFFNALRFLPDTWSTFKCDLIFCPKASPASEALIERASELCKFLKLMPLPPVDCKKLMQRMLYELNLPLELHLIIFDNKFLFERFQDLMQDQANRRLCLPRHDVLILMVILVVLRKYFILEDEKELFKQFSTCPFYLQTYNQFDPLFWIQCTRTRVKLLKHHYTPLWQESVSSLHDTQVAHQFYRQFASHWQHTVTHCKRRRMYDEKPFRDKMKQLISSACEQNDSEVLLPRPSLTFLSDATLFVKDRVDDANLRNILSVNFRHKSLSYLVKSSKFNKRHYEPIVTNNCDINQLPEPVNLYLTIASWMVHEDKDKLLRQLKLVEKKFGAFRRPRPAPRKPRPQRSAEQPAGTSE